jgi:hypothetical protein
VGEKENDILDFTVPNMMHTDCANCDWYTPCYNDGEAYICIDRDICVQNRRINDLTRERNEAIARCDALLRASQDVLDHLVYLSKFTKQVSTGVMSQLRDAIKSAQV